MVPNRNEADSVRTEFTTRSDVHEPARSLPAMREGRSGNAISCCQAETMVPSIGIIEPERGAPISALCATAGKVEQLESEVAALRAQGLKG